MPEGGAAGPAASGLGVRVASALILAPIVLAIAYVGGWPFAVLVGAAGIIAAAEWTALAYGSEPPAMRRVEFWLLVAAVPGAVAAVALGKPGIALAVVAATLAVGLGWRGARGAPVASFAFGAVYVLAPLIAMVWLRADPAYGRAVLFWLLAVVWATDIGAYFTGRAIGGPRIAPRFSPKKTWAGLGGGVAAAAAAGAATTALLGEGALWKLALLSGSLAVVAQIGDFVESALKRRAGVKDSGTLIPGHGGMLDRIDGLVFAAVAAALVAVVHPGPSPAAGVMIWP